MRHLSRLAGISLLTLLTACGSPQAGYYDANGNWVPPENATGRHHREHSPSPGMHAYHDQDHRPGSEISYNRAGYYDYYGNFVSFDQRIPRGMMPGRGMCRVWLPDREPDRQPAVETCDGIQHRVPPGAYVIYGG